MPGALLFIPLYQLLIGVRLTDSLWSLVVTYPTFTLPFATWLLAGYFSSIPVELEEAALVDGSNFLQTMWLVVAPLMKPAFVTMFLVNLVVTWNELFYPLVFATTSNTRPLTIGLIQLTQVNSGTSTRPWDLMSTLSAFMIVPIIAVIALGQRRIIAGLMTGAGK
jgi:multiple sugar transport system permease protein